MPFQYEKVPDQPNLWYVKSQTVNLAEFAANSRLDVPADITYQVHPITFDGPPVRLPENATLVPAANVASTLLPE